MAIARTVNFDDAVEWADLLDELRQLRGHQKVTVEQKRLKASRKQFQYYYGCVLVRAKHWLNDTQGGQNEPGDFTEHDADLFLKRMVRGVPKYSRGRLVAMVVPSKATFNTLQMYEFTEDAVTWLRKNGCPVPAPDPKWREAKAKAQREATAEQRKSA